MKFPAFFIGVLLSLSVVAQNDPCKTAFSLPDVFDLSKMTDSTRYKPVIADSIRSDYSFQIMDRFGEQIFGTDIPEQGWNGLYHNRKGQIAEGTYMWMLSYTTTDSSIVSCNGFMSLVNANVSVKVTALDTLQCTLNFYVPNAFTPNDDSFNDMFMPTFGCRPVEYEMFIYDRWGSLIFQTKEVDKGWDGNTATGLPATTDTYVWKIKFRYFEGDKRRSYVGHVALIR